MMDAALYFFSNNRHNSKTILKQVTTYQPLPNSQLKVQFKQGSKYNVRDIMWKER